MNKAMHGTVTGNFIRINEPLELAEGTVVEVVLRPLVDSEPKRQERLESLFGSCSEQSENLEEFLKQNAEQRRLTRREIEH